MAATDSPTDNRIVVGVDGSDSSRTALRWALEFGERSHIPVVAMTVWRYPADFPYGMTPPSSPEVWHPDADAARVLDDTIRAVTGEHRSPALLAVTCEGHPAEVLVRESASAQLLVVGSRGHGRLTGRLLGSVGASCAEHAHCPVAIIRGHQGGAADAAAPDGAGRGQPRRRREADRSSGTVGRSDE